MKAQDEMAKRGRSFHAVILGALLCAAPISAAFAQTTINAGSVIDVLPSTSASVPISIVLPGGTPCATMQFNLTVVANGGAPAIATNVGFTSSVGATSQNINNGPGTRLVGWFSNFDPLLTGTTAVGTLSVPIPAGAQSGQTYTVQVLNPSGTTDGETDLPMSGVNGTITIGVVGVSPTPTSTPPTVIPPTPTSTPPTPATPTPTNTVPPPTITATKLPVTATATATRVPASQTPGACPTCEDDDGCQIGATGHSSAWLLLVPAVGLLALRRRRR